MADPDLKGVRLLTPAELSERRFRRTRRLTAKKPVRKKKVLRVQHAPAGRRTIVATVSIRPELKFRATRELGEGSFSKAVVRALKHALLRLDETAAVLPVKKD